MASPEVFELVVTATHARHGCSREVPAEQTFSGCGSLDCPDCLTAKFLQDLVRCGANISSATIMHDPSGEKVLDTFGYGYLAKRDPIKSRADRSRKPKWPSPAPVTPPLK